MSVVTGRVRKFGDNLNTDIIAPGPFLHLPLEELKRHAFAPLDPDFHASVEPGDVIVAGSNFGCGSSREPATAILGALGIRFVVCDSMARIYFRNCTALGIYPVLCPGAAALFDEGDSIAIDIERGRVTRPADGRELAFEPLSGTPREIFEHGGILALLKARFHGAAG
jgi:3-isopropylmalate dehydratase small subunit